uniref:Secreted protein n=1 Tax=Oryza glumipatula TaxID=40148 RepID=A0A0E0AUE2_9ORYZ
MVHGMGAGLCIASVLPTSAAAASFDLAVLLLEVNLLSDLSTILKIMRVQTLQNFQPGIAISE